MEVVFYAVLPDFRRKDISFFEVSQPSPFCPSGTNNMYLKMSVELWWNDNCRRNAKVFEEILSQCQFLNNKSHKDRPGIESGSPQWQCDNRPSVLWHGLKYVPHSEQIFPLKVQSRNVVERITDSFLERILGITQIMCVQSTEVSALSLTVPTVTTGL